MNLFTIHTYSSTNSVPNYLSALFPVIISAVCQFKHLFSVKLSVLADNSGITLFPWLRLCRFHSCITDRNSSNATQTIGQPHLFHQLFTLFRRKHLDFPIIQQRLTPKAWAANIMFSNTQVPSWIANRQSSGANTNI